MSLDVINQILGLAAVDSQFRQELLKHPVTATRSKGFVLTSEEKKILVASKARNLQELSQYLLKQLK